MFYRDQPAFRYGTNSPGPGSDLNLYIPSRSGPCFRRAAKESHQGCLVGGHCMIGSLGHKRRASWLVRAEIWITQRYGSDSHAPSPPPPLGLRPSTAVPAARLYARGGNPLPVCRSHAVPRVDVCLLRQQPTFQRRCHPSGFNGRGVDCSLARRTLFPLCAACHFSRAGAGSVLRHRAGRHRVRATGPAPFRPLGGRGSHVLRHPLLAGPCRVLWNHARVTRMGNGVEHSGLRVRYAHRLCPRGLAGNAARPPAPRT